MIEVKEVVSDSKFTRLRKALQKEFFDKYSELYAVNYICETLSMKPFTLMDFMRGDDSALINLIEPDSLDLLLGSDWRKYVHEARSNTGY